MNRVLPSPMPKREKTRHPPASRKTKAAASASAAHNQILAGRRSGVQLQAQNGGSVRQFSPQVVQQQQVYGQPNVNQGYMSNMVSYGSAYPPQQSDTNQQQWVTYPHYGAVKANPHAPHNGPQTQAFFPLHHMQQQAQQHMQQQQQQQPQHQQHIPFMVHGGMQVPVQVQVNQGGGQYEVMQQMGMINRQPSAVQVPQNLVHYQTAQPMHFTHR